MPWGFAAAGAASGVAGAAASSAGGKKGSNQSRQSEALSQEQANAARTARDLAVAQSSLTQGLRSTTVNQLQNFLWSGKTPQFLDLPANVAPTTQLATLSIPEIQAQQQAQQQQLRNAGVRGGQLTQALGNAAIQGGLQRASVLQSLGLNDIQRQQARDEARAGIRQQLFGAATDLGTGGVTQTQQGLGNAMSGLANAASNLNTLGAQRIGQNMQLQGSLGNIAGKGLGYAAGQYLPAYNSGSLGAQKAGGRASSVPMSAPGGKA